MDVTTAIYSSMALGVVLGLWLAWNEPWLAPYRTAAVVVVLMGGAGLVGGIAAGPVGALLGVAGAGITVAVWRASVNRSAPAAADYVTDDETGQAEHGMLPARGNAEEEYWREAEAMREAPGALTASDINRLLEEAREQGAARALGSLIGAGLLPEGNRSRSMQALFGPAGRRHTRVRPWVAEAEGAARAARPDEPEAEEAHRVVTVSPGRPEERKLVL